MRLAYFTPLPPSKSGIADYNAELLPYLARGAEITVFVEQANEVRENRNREDFPVHNAVHFDEIHLRHPFDLCIYHQGNNPYHEFIYERALETPGLLALHEHCLHHLIAWRTLAREDQDGYWNEMFYAYGRQGARMAGMRDRAVSSEYQQFLMPLNRRLTERSLGVVVHNAYAASQLEGLNEDWNGDTPVEIIPHHLSPKAFELDRMDKLECRRSLGIPDDAWAIASLGFITESKRIPTVLSAFKRLLRLVPNAIYLVVGEDHWRWSVAPLIEELGLQSHVRITGYATERDFFRYLKAVDVIVNLRFPTAGETSGTLIRALGAGKPVIVTDFGQFGELPDDVVMKVPIGPDEERDLLRRLQALSFRPTLRESLSRRAAEWTRTECEISRSAARYLNLAERIIEKRKSRRSQARPHQVNYQLEFKQSPAITFDRDEALGYIAGFYADDPNASGYIQLHRDRLIRTVELIPVGDKDQRLLELSSYLQMPLMIERYGNYGEVAVTNWWPGEPREKIITVRNPVTGEEFGFPMKNVDVERDRFPFPDDHFDVALCCELIEHLREDPMHMLVELNRVVKWGGLVILTTPNITSAFAVQESLAGRNPTFYSVYNRQSPADRHSREYTPAEVRVALEAAGFKVIRLFTENVWHQTDEEFLAWLDHTGVPRELRGDNIYAVGRKQSAQIDRYPHELYD
jgi:glycosyltransferase involved in cell wall biosynthesis/SAM-dependent methyltransferase